MKEDKITVKELAKNITNYNDLIKKLAENVTKIEEKIPELNESLALVRQKYEEIEETIKNNVTNSLKYVQFLIDNSHSLLDHLRLAMAFDDTTKLVLNAPKAAYDPTVYNEINMVMKRSEGSSSNAMLFFIGNGDNPDDNDYLAMEMLDSKLIFHFKLSSGQSQSVTVEKEILIGPLYTLNVKRFV